ncbi:glycosyl hydrolase family 28-related protein [Flavobacterium sp.]|uniref:glycosyl hydrolase family 28-related protein n=1 Tax=Flavobacterium sp. TaxID=239 RepID=UPI0025B8B6F2|nr:glycosyl hydrolase family 28-related protein [Flavobacterium sp.]
MKKIILFLLFSIVSFAQVPQGMSHRGIAYNSNGTILTGPISIRVRILQGTSNGSVDYVETYNLNTNLSGQYNINIGQGNVVSGNFNSIDWSTGQKWLEIGIAPGHDQTNYFIGSSQLMSVPYALYAESSSNGFETVDNIADLRNYNSYTNNKIIYAKGYYTAGDGGEGFFTYKENETLADNEGIVIKPNSVSGNGRWIRQYSGYINVNYFGLKGWLNPSDPFSNSDRIQKIIDYCASNNQNNTKSSMVILFPSGEYFIDKTIILKNKVKIIGEPNTLFTLRPGFTFDYMIEMGSGPITDCLLSDFIINLRNEPNVGGMHFKAVGENGSGGIWTSQFRNILIVNNKGNGIYLEGDDGSDVNNDRPNQTLIFENVNAVRKEAFTNCLKITGQLGQTTFINCGFDAENTKGVNVSITEPLYEGSAVVSFINCTFQSSEYGVQIKKADNITFDNCWFEALDLAIDVNDSNAINILNSRFANAAGYGSRTDGVLPAGQGRCITANNSSINVERNYVTVSDPNSMNVRGEKFILGVNNSTINAKNNEFQHPNLSETFGIMNVLNSNTSFFNNGNLNIGTKKLIFATVPAGVTQLNRINSEIIAGETIFLRANQGSIQINAMDSNGLTNKNIFLNGRTSLTLQNGQAATFIKIDNIIGQEKCTYQLVSISN